MIELIGDESKSRVDSFIARFVPEINRSSATKLCEEGRVYVAGKPTKASYKVKVSDKVEVDYKPQDTKLPDIDIDILYEDDDCIVISKPAGVLSHSKGAFNPESTVASFIADKLSGFEGSERDGIVHRLDRLTSGVMICAKNPKAQKWLQKQFSQRKVKKTYVAIINSDIEPESAIIDMPIGRNPKKPRQFCITNDGRLAETYYEVKEKSNQYTELYLIPKTGRTHQLRVHLQYLKKPIVGDELYGGEPAERMFLHAKELEVTLPDKTRQKFVADLPQDFHNKMHA